MLSYLTAEMGVLQKHSDTTKLDLSLPLRAGEAVTSEKAQATVCMHFEAGLSKT